MSKCCLELSNDNRRNWIDVICDEEEIIAFGSFCKTAAIDNTPSDICVHNDSVG